MLRRIRVEFQTKPVDIEPVSEGVLAGCSQSRYMTYVKYVSLDWNKYDIMSPCNQIEFYGDRYTITGIGLLPKRSVSITVTEEQLARFLAKAKEQKHRWRKTAMTSIDARSVVSNLAMRASMN